MKIEHKYFVLTQQGECNNLAKLHEYMNDGWMPSRETTLNSSTSVPSYEKIHSQSDRKNKKQSFSHCLILLYRET